MLHKNIWISERISKEGERVLRRIKTNSRGSVKMWSDVVMWKSNHICNFLSLLWETKERMNEDDKNNI